MKLFHDAIKSKTPHMLEGYALILFCSLINSQTVLYSANHYQYTFGCAESVEEFTKWGQPGSEPRVAELVRESKVFPLSRDYESISYYINRIILFSVKEEFIYAK